MAVIQYSALLTQLRGKLGGSQFNKGKTGFSLQRKSNPTIRQTPAQLRQRQAVATAQRGWKSETQTRRAEAAQVAISNPASDRFGQQVTLSGYNQYVKIQTRRLLVSGNQEPLLLNRAFITTPVLGGRTDVSSLIIANLGTSSSSGVNYTIQNERSLVVTGTGGNGSSRLYFYIHKAFPDGALDWRSRWVYFTRQSVGSGVQGQYNVPLQSGIVFNTGDWVMVRIETWNVDAGARTAEQMILIQIS